MFRQERPQKGRQRQFHQFGVEALGSASPLMDAEVMILFDTIAEKLGIKERIYLLNSVGGAASRARYKDALMAFLSTVEKGLCEDCRRRQHTNPLRVLDCKVPGCRELIHGAKALPRTVEYLVDSDILHYEQVKKIMSDRGVRFREDYTLVRGLDYYTGPVFEMQYEGIGAQSAIMGGGRYDTLVRELGGADLPAVGFACGIERLILAMQTSSPAVTEQPSRMVYLIASHPEVRDRTVEYLYRLRSLGNPAEMDYLDRSMKAQMKTAARLNARYTLIVEQETVTVRDMEKSEQESMTFENFLEKVRVLSER
jgi:histidyl-tRNA synthetase